MLNLDKLIGRVRATVENHKLEEGVYARWLWQNEKGTRKMGANEYGCADAANIRYMIGDMPETEEERRACIAGLQAFQREDGLFFEGTHHELHCTAHCTAAMELFDVKPALPMTGILVFTVMPIVFMILVAFTNYDGNHNGFSNSLFTWVGWDNFSTLLTWTGDGRNYSATFGEVLTWTLLWAFFATFTNYFLGMGVAMMINKKGIHMKKFWRTCLVMTIAVPQFISLLYVSKLFANDGLVNGLLMDWGWIDKPLPFWTDGSWARVMVIMVNIWVGIPYLMLIATGILMNIPQDLYESAKVDGAGAWKQYTRITLPYMLFVTGPYLLTQFTSNLNNFNVIYLLTAGDPASLSPAPAGSNLGQTDLLVTWLFKLATGTEADYHTASVLGILVFAVVAIISLIIYNVMPSTKNEEDFQ
jgi:arabinogalactan oligomer/maltooligosaccharide transport system permease protein